MVRIHQNLARNISRRATDSLDKRSLASQKSFFVRVEYRHERYLRQIQPFTQEVHSDQHVKITLPEVCKDFNALQGFHIAVKIIYLYPLCGQIFAQIFGHFFGKSGDKNSLFSCNPLLYARNQILHLALGRQNGDFRINKPGRTDYLFYNFLANLFLIRPRGRGGKDYLTNSFVEFFKAQRPVIRRGWQTESVFNQSLFARRIALGHSSDLGNSHVRFINNGQEIRRP